jgi:hypothetical protein
MFGLDLVQLANVLLVGTTVLLGCHFLYDKLIARNARRQAVREASIAAEKLGLDKLPKLGYAYSDGDYPEFRVRLKEFVKMLTGDKKILLGELSGMLEKLASTADGLKMIQDAIAKAATPVVAAA